MLFDRLVRGRTHGLSEALSTKCDSAWVNRTKTRQTKAQEFADSIPEGQA